ncbi:curli assembly protein CsgF [Noviherbaspirillum malthae]|uniref:curli assembly protein CsgF n=1 Tax=Noviherbaspirillum malthae TaxID=1260987 RepID=UPI00188ED797|nr:curli assembly protein CsgF [Noviherbaspirillum malthae]
MKTTCLKGMAGIGCAFAILAALTTLNAQATELVYVPINPSFGGSPLYGSVLLGSAQATNKHKEADASGLGALGQDPLKQFNESLERAVLGQLASSATSKILVNGQLVPGTIETGNFRINVIDAGGGSLTVTTTDKVTGASSSFVVGK